MAGRLRPVSLRCRCACRVAARSCCYMNFTSLTFLLPPTVFCPSPGPGRSGGPPARAPAAGWTDPAAVRICRVASAVSALVS